MKLRTRSFYYFIVLVIGLIFSAPFLSSKTLGAYAQSGNSISGYVYGLNRQPMADLNVELLDDFGRTVARARTNGWGYYEFNGLSAGNFSVRVYTFGTDYAEQENRVEEIVNVNVETGGGTRTVGFTQEESDFYLRLRRGLTPAAVAVFAQDVPPEAQKLYDKAIADMRDKRDAQALVELKGAVEAFPRYFAALERLGTAYIQMGLPESFQAAEILLAVAIDVNPRAYKSWYGLAYARYSLGNFADALAAAQKAVELNSSSPDAVFLSGVLMRQTKRYPEAEKQLLKARELSKDTLPRVHWELALLYGNHMDRFADAAKELKLFLAAQPDSKDSGKIKKLIADFEAKAQNK